MQDKSNSTGYSSASTPDPTASGAPREQAGAAGFGQAAAEKVDANRSSAASGLDSAASAIHEKADGLPGGESVKGAAHTAANALSSTADYVRENDVKSMLADAQKLVRNNPGPALLTAAVLGFLVARAISRD
jgi:ElaB/YqjD/DUF883 family membrane-anchored ribosome-binding protein